MGIYQAIRRKSRPLLQSQREGKLEWGMCECESVGYEVGGVGGVFPHRGESPGRRGHQRPQKIEETPYGSLSGYKEKIAALSYSLEPAGKL